MTSSSAPDTSNLLDYALDWALVDVETSGLVARRDRVLSIAVVTIDKDGRQTGEFSTLLDPGCDPGPVHVHGLTPERLSGAPTFDQVAGRIAEMLRDRVLVAHNAQFDYDFLAHEFARAGVHLPVARRLCTLALNRRVDPPTDDMRLGTLAAHYGVPQTQAHDALDDTRVLAGILRASLAEAARLDLALPLVACPPRQNARYAPQPPKTPCAYRNPGKLAPGDPLVQGMKIAITGETETGRAELAVRSSAAGLNVMQSVSRYTSALVTNDSPSASAKGRRAVAEGIVILDERAFLQLLDDVRPGTPHEKPAAAPATASVPAARTPEPATTESKPLAGRRVLVLGGAHESAAEARARIVALGGSAAINLSASVTDVVLLPGGENDRRMARISSLLLPTHDADWLAAPGVRAVPAPDERSRSPRTLPCGGVVDLPVTGEGTRWDVGVSWAQQTSGEIDVVAFVVDEDEQVACDEDFVFYGAPESPNGSVRLLGDGPTEQTISVDLAAMPPAARKVVVCAAIDGTLTFGDVGAVQITAAPGTGAMPLARAAVDAATTERTMLLAEIYRRGPLWRFRAVGQGHDHGLAELARAYGVDVAD
ncbi:TerD family protein [Streptomyces sp. NPDC091371]|uniref:TerD family protein n=1 Tax=Streptomyces sp. NPDC091371 TaxID=3155303 RepID=UPI0034151FDC